MAKEPFYITRSGRLRRKHNTVQFEHEDGKIFLPVEQIESIYLMTSMELNTELLEFFNQKKIPIHFFGYYRNYIGSFMPKETYISGNVLMRQVLAASELSERIPLAKEILRGAQANIMKNVRQLQRNHPSEEIDRIACEIEQEIAKNVSVTSISQLMGLEGIIRKKYYQIIDEVMKKVNPEFVMGKRVKRSPNNKMNSLVSFINSMVYSTTLNEIYHTHLNPTISFLHEPGERRYSLALDISEVFKPLLSDRLIFRLVNLKMLNDKHFDQMGKICYLNQKGLKKVLEEYNNKLSTTMKHRSLGRHVSYRRYIRLECYKLVKHLLGEKVYTSFKMSW